MRRVIGASLFLLACASTPLSVEAAKAFPPSPRTYVHNEGIITGGAADRISRRLSDLEAKTGHQFVVALFQSLDGENLEKYTNLLYKEWKIGGKKSHTGLLFALYQKDRKWRVEIGYGMEGTITDLEAAAIANDFAVPHFKNGDFDGGVIAAVEELARKVEGLPRSTPPRSSDVQQALGWLGWLLLFIVRNPEFLLLVFIPIMLFGDMMTRGRSTYSKSGKRRSRGSFWDTGSSGGGSSWGGGGGGWSSGGGGGFSGGGGSSGGGGASGGW